MKGLMLIAVLVGGGCWYAAKRISFRDTLAYTHKNAGKPWADRANYSIGLIYFQRRDFDKSQEAFTQLLSDQPTTQFKARALLRLSEVAENRRDFETARQSLRAFLEEFPGHSGRQIAEKRLELLQNR